MSKSERIFAKMLVNGKACAIMEVTDDLASGPEIREEDRTRGLA